MTAKLSLRIDLDAAHEADSLGSALCMTVVDRISDGGGVRRGGVDELLLYHVQGNPSGARGSVAAQSGRR